MQLSVSVYFIILEPSFEFSSICKFYCTFSLFFVFFVRTPILKIFLFFISNSLFKIIMKKSFIETTSIFLKKFSFPLFFTLNAISNIFCSIRIINLAFTSNVIFYTFEMSLHKCTNCSIFFIYL